MSGEPLIALTADADSVLARAVGALGRFPADPPWVLVGGLAVFARLGSINPADRGRRHRRPLTGPNRPWRGGHRTMRIAENRRGGTAPTIVQATGHHDGATVPERQHQHTRTE